mmetsp:Transcript_97573/g.315045  ORF Transcript_97573/g.315045 Transcript_97573/m.315045 type:complete len:81 (+) Transcript_97573:38-280(+)
MRAGLGQMETILAPRPLSALDSHEKSEYMRLDSDGWPVLDRATRAGGAALAAAGWGAGPALRVTGPRPLPMLCSWEKAPE